MTGLRDQIAEALRTAAVNLNYAPEGLADAVMAAVRPELDQRDAAADELATELAEARTEFQKQDAELKGLREAADIWERASRAGSKARADAEALRDGWCSRAEQAEAELDRRDAEIEQLQKDLRTARLEWSRIDIDNTNLIVRNEVAIRKWDALTKKLYTAWWSARIGRAEARQEVADGLKAFWDAHAASLEWQQRAILAEHERDQLKAELRRLHALFDEAHQSLPIEQRRLLSISRMVFDRHAEGDTLSRDEAADLAQRIVDEIGHPVTEEPALGPSFRVEIERLKRRVTEVEAQRNDNAEWLRAVDSSWLDLAAKVGQHEDLLASIALYIKWRYVTKQLTTEQKDLFADALERVAFRAHGPDGDEPDPDMARLPSYAPRWWRDDHTTALDQPADSKEPR